MLRDEVTIVVLAGGRATRLPGKLERDVLGEPLLARVYSNVRDCAPVVISASGAFSDSLDARLDCPIVVDRWRDRGPLAGLLSACSTISSPWIAAVAGDAPHVTGEIVRTLFEHRRERDEAVVPEHDRRLEPLAALYERAALEREAYDVLHNANGSMHALLDRVRIRTVPLATHYFHNVNTVADLGAV